MIIEVVNSEHPDKLCDRLADFIAVNFDKLTGYVLEPTVEVQLVGNEFRVQIYSEMTPKELDVLTEACNKFSDEFLGSVYINCLRDPDDRNVLISNPPAKSFNTSLATGYATSKQDKHREALRKIINGVSLASEWPLKLQAYVDPIKDEITRVWASFIEMDDSSNVDSIEWRKLLEEAGIKDFNALSIMFPYAFLGQGLKGACNRKTVQDAYGNNVLSNGEGLNGKPFLSGGRYNNYKARLLALAFLSNRNRKDVDCEVYVNLVGNDMTVEFIYADEQDWHEAFYKDIEKADWMLPYDSYLKEEIGKFKRSEYALAPSTFGHFGIEIGGVKYPWEDLDLFIKSIK